MNNDFKQYTVEFNPADIPALYSDWEWLIRPNYLNDPWLMTSFGDLFFKAADSSIHFIDTLNGAIIPIAENQESAEALLSDPVAQNQYLSSETVDELKEQGLALKQDELYAYVPHPALNNGTAEESIQVMSMKLALSLCGQLLRQVVTES